MCSRVMHLVALVCIYVCVYMWPKKQAVYALPLENLLLSVMSCLLLQCGLLHPASCTNRVIHAFPNKTRASPWPRNIFFWTLMAHHTLWARLGSCSGTSCVLQ